MVSNVTPIDVKATPATQVFGSGKGLEDKAAFMHRYDDALDALYSAASKMHAAYWVTTKVFNNHDPRGKVKNFRDEPAEDYSPQSLIHEVQPGFMYLARHLRSLDNGAHGDAYSKYADHLNIMASAGEVLPEDPESFMVMRKIFGPGMYLENAEIMLSAAFDYNPQFAKNLMDTLKQKQSEGARITKEELVFAQRALNDLGDAYNDLRSAAAHFADEIREGVDMHFAGNSHYAGK